MPQEFAPEDEAIFEDFAAKILEMAQDLARTNSQYSTREILERSLEITVSAAKRLKMKKVSGWHVAMAEEKELFAPDIRQPQPGKGIDGRKGFDGRYAQHVAEVYRDPTKKEYYRQRAAEINAESRVCSMESLKKVQRKKIKRLITYVNDFGQYDINLVLMTVPSKAKPHLFTTSGFAASYYRLLARDGRGQDQFATMCDGGRLLRDAEALPGAQLDSRKRNDLRSETAMMLLELISKIKYLNILELQHTDM